MKFSAAVFVIVLALAIMVGSSDAFAQKRPKRATCAQRFTRMDLNKDGSISLGEFLAFSKSKRKAKAVFRAKDLNRDGFLNIEEFCRKR